GVYPVTDTSSLVNHNAYMASSSAPQIDYASMVQHSSKYSPPETGLVVPVFQKGDDPIDAINHMMSFLTAVVTSRYHATNNQLRTSSNPRQQATINNGRVTIQLIQGRQNFVSAGSSRPFTSGSGGALGKQRVIVCYNCKGGGQMSKQCTKPKRKRDAEWFKDKIALMANLSHYGSDNLAEIELSAEQAFWSQYSVQTDEPNLSATTTIVEVLKELPKVSMGTWGFEHTKACFRDDIIPFVKALKELFASFDQYLIDEVTEVQNVFKQMELVVEQLLTDTSSLVNHNAYMASSSAPQIDYAPMVQQSSEYSPPEAGLVVPVFQKGDDPIDAINHMMSFLTAVVTSRGGRILRRLVCQDRLHQDQEEHHASKGSLCVTTAKVRATCPSSAQNLRGSVMQNGSRIKYLQTDEPNLSATTTIVEVLKELPKVSMVNSCLKKLKSHLASFDMIVKEKTTATAITKGTWGFKHTKSCFHDDIIPFVKALKELFTSFDQYLIDEVTEVQHVFKQIELAVEQHREEKHNFQNKMEHVLQENDRLLTQALSVEIVHVAVHDNVMFDCLNVNVCAHCVTIESELKKDFIKKECYEMLLQQYQTLEKHCISLEVNNQLKQENSQKNTLSSSKKKLRSLNGDVNERSVKREVEEIETLNLELDHKYVEGLRHNLFSVGQFCDSNLEVAFRQHTCFIRNLEVVDLLTSSQGNNLYTLSLQDMMASSLICPLSKASKTKSWLWHPCAMCKSTKKTHKPKSEDTNQEKLYLLYMYLCGPMHNGTEFVNQTLRDYYEEVGISHETSIARSPQQNGVVERRNRTLIEAARTMLIYAQAPLFLWAEAVATACFTTRAYISSSTSFVPPSRNDWDLLFQLIFDELLNPPPSVVNQAAEVIAPITEVIP
nr:putative ribonuclease H-like domain-containing protein [Tanacetum cinerariifolium]